MTTLEVSATRYHLTVSARAVLDNVMSNYDTEIGDRLVRAMSILTSNRQGAIIAPAGVEVTQEMAMVDDTDDLPEHVHLLEDLTDHGARESLHGWGFLGAWDNVTVVRDGVSYLDEDLYVDNVTVTRAFTVTPVDYLYTGRTCTGARLHTGAAVTVPVGGYVWGGFGTYQSRGECAGYVGEDLNMLPTLEGLYDVEGFDAHRMSAGCNTCEGRWYAEGGSWRFRAEHNTQPEVWQYDDAEFPDADDAPDNVVCCPYVEAGYDLDPDRRCKGYVGFMAF